jgi:hypothetical protein
VETLKEEEESICVSVGWAAFFVRTSQEPIDSGFFSLSLPLLRYAVGMSFRKFYILLLLRDFSALPTFLLQADFSSVLLASFSFAMITLNDGHYGDPSATVAVFACAVWVFCMRSNKNIGSHFDCPPPFTYVLGGQSVPIRSPICCKMR